MQNNTQQKISNPINGFVNMILNANPQARQLLNMLNGMHPEDAKDKVLSMAQNGQMNKQQLVQFVNLAKQMGFNDEQIHELDEITFKGNRW